MSHAVRSTEIDDQDILDRLAQARQDSSPLRVPIGDGQKSHLFAWQGARVYPWVARRLFHPVLCDPRNDCFAAFTLLMLCTVLPSAVWLLLDFAWWRALVHIGLVLHHAASFTIILHNSCHKTVYAVGWMNHIVPAVLGPLFGQTWNTYYYHHVKHHHVENNGPNDLSSTLRFQRDSILDFTAYFLRFMFCIAIELPKYFVHRGHYWNAASSMFGELAGLALAIALARVNLLGALFVFFVPLIVVRFGMMSGNWAQHAFIDQVDPKCNYKSSVTCVHHSYNRKAFNDGYHTSHHLNPRRHWSEHPAHLVREISVYYASRPIVLHSIDLMGLWARLMMHDYAGIARLYVHLGPESERPSQQEIVDLLKSRTRAFSEEEILRHYPRATVPARCYRF